MGKHTPGPWRKHQPSAHTGNWWIEQLPADSVAIETMHGAGAFGQVVAATPGNNHADAALIAAAPDLLAWAHESEHARNCRLKYSRDGAGCTCGRNAAIAKAEGRESSATDECDRCGLPKDAGRHGPG